jgi:hypothetical protein
VPRRWFGSFKESRHFWLEDSPGQKWRDHEKTNEGTDVFASRAPECKSGSDPDSQLSRLALMRCDKLRA